MRRRSLKENTNFTNLKRKKLIEDIIAQISAKLNSKCEQNSSDNPKESESSLEPSTNDLTVTSTKENSTEDEGRPAADAKEVKEAIASEMENTDASIKCPSKVDATIVPDDISQPHAETDVIQMDLQKSLNGSLMPPSPFADGRIRLRPILGQRRKRFVGASSSLLKEDRNVNFTPEQLERFFFIDDLAIASKAQLNSSTCNNGIRTESSAIFDSSATSNCERKVRKGTKRLTNKDFSDMPINGVPDISKMTMKDFIYYSPETNPMIPKSEEPVYTETIDYNSDILKLNANGEPEIDSKYDENMNVNALYNQPKRKKEWSCDETEKFYQCSQTVGTDFALMGELYPENAKCDLKLKLKKEEQANDRQINKVLRDPQKFNIDEIRNQYQRKDCEQLKRNDEIIKAFTTVKTKEIVSFDKTAKTTENIKTDVSYTTAEINNIAEIDESVKPSNYIIQKQCLLEEHTTQSVTSKETLGSAGDPIKSVDKINVEMEDHDNITQTLVQKVNMDAEEVKEHIVPIETIMAIIADLPDNSIILPFDDYTIIPTTTMFPSIRILNISPTIFNLDNDTMSQLIVFRDKM